MGEDDQQLGMLSFPVCNNHRKRVKMAIEKRRYRRYIFPNDEKMKVNLQLAGEGNTIQARLLNVSEGGLGLAVTKEQTSGVEIDSELLINDLENIPELQGLKNVQLKVRWVLNHDPLKNLGVGCEFVNLPANGKEDIFALIENGTLRAA